MSATLNDSIQTNAPKSLDNKYLFNGLRPYVDVAEANATLISSYRTKGLTVLIGNAEYWYRDDILNGNLIAKGNSFVSGVDIKTINSVSVLGSGDLAVGTVTSTGTANRLSYYSAIGNTVTPLAAITASRAIVSDGSGLPTASTVTLTELSYVSGVTSSVQTQLDSKQVALVSGTTLKTINTVSLLGSGDMSIGGVTTLNTLTALTQTFAKGTTAQSNDWGIISSSSTHTFHFPDASATNRGLLTTTDWSTFNNKVATSRSLTVNGTTLDLSADRTFVVTDANLSTSDITTNDATTSKHGFLPKLPGGTTTFLRADGTFATPPGSGTGTVTSVAMTVPAAFSVAGSPITTSGTLAITATGSTGEYIRGDGSLATYTGHNSDGPVNYVQVSDGSLGFQTWGNFINNGTTVTISSSGTSLLQVTGSDAAADGMIMHHTVSTGQFTCQITNDRGGNSLGAFSYYGSANPGANIFGLTRPDRFFIFADGVNNLGMAVGTIQDMPLYFGTNNTETMRLNSQSLMIGATTLVNGEKVRVNGRIQLDGAVAYGTSTKTDADTTIAATDNFVILPVVTANRNLTLPSPATNLGRRLIIWNKNTSGTFHWSFAANAVDAASATITTLTNVIFYNMICDGTNWVKSS